ncbi:MAG: hypothetical protein IPJ79_04355 [Bacteroidetes bacterium]|nr:hypothetical protein [Bacteroidota bacterium]
MALKADFSLRIDNAPVFETLHINRKKRSINAIVGTVSFQDKDTLQHVLYMPSLGISSYGQTTEKAETMLKESINDYFKYLIDLRPEKLEIELKNHGWIHDAIRSKDFSKAYVDIDGTLQNFNAVDNKVRMSLQAVTA